MYIPQAGRGPAFPVFRDSSFPPFPRSSVPAWTTTVRYNKVSLVPRPIQGFLTYSDNALGANQLDQLVGDSALAIALGIGLEVA